MALFLSILVLVFVSIRFVNPEESWKNAWFVFVIVLP